MTQEQSEEIEMFQGMSTHSPITAKWVPIIKNGHVYTYLKLKKLTVLFSQQHLVIVQETFLIVIEMCIVVILSSFVIACTCFVVDSLMTKVKLTLKDCITFTFAIQQLLDKTFTSHPGNCVKSNIFPVESNSPN